MIRIVDQAGAVVEKDCLSFLERDTVLRDVGSGLSSIPGKFDIAHSIILAISQAGGACFSLPAIQENTRAVNPMAAVTPQARPQSRSIQAR
jgi:hypothetical protein